MKSLGSLWKRRSLRAFGVFAVACALPLLHPFIRQSIFGPTIDGIPWCVWEDDIRAGADPDQRKPSWLREALEKFGLIGQQHIGLDANVNALPVYMHLADDSDVRIRRIALSQLSNWRTKHDDILPILCLHIDDPDPHCRMVAAGTVWEVTKHPDLVDTFLAFKDHADPEIQYLARLSLCTMARADTKLFDTIATFAEDPNQGMRFHAVHAMRHFGKKGVPILLRAFADKGQGVRNAAVMTAGALGKDARDLIPSLQALQNDPDAVFRSQVEGALHRIDPMRFAKPTDPVE